MPLLEVTDDEKALIEQMREWKDGIPESAMGQGKEDAIYVHLIAARAELAILAMRHNHNDYLDRRQNFVGLVSPWVGKELAKSWLDLRRRERDDEAREMELEED